MDKYEYRIRAEEINSLIEQGEFLEALKIAETIDWRRVRSVVMLCKVSELYKMNRQYEESKDILLMANDIKPNSRKVIYSLCELSIKLEETVQAVEYYKQYIQIAPRDADRFILQYRLYEAQDVSLEERIAVLEEFKKRDYQEKWAYELAYLYHRIGLATRCVEECDELILWFVDGKYVIKAMELKMLHAPLTLSQQEKYNARFMEEQEAIALTEEPDEEEIEETPPAMSISVKKVEPTRAKTTKIPTLRLKKGPQLSSALEEPDEEEIEEAEETEEIEETEDEDIRIAGSAAETDDEKEPTIDLGGAIKNVIIPERNTDELAQAAMEEAQAYENERAGQEQEDDEDADMKIVTPDADEIRVRTIDAGNRFDTMNLEEETTKYLAGEIVRLMAEEDMGAADATRALPMNSIFHDSIDSLDPRVITKAMELAQEMNEQRIAENAESYEPVEELEEIYEADEDEVTEAGFGETRRIPDLGDAIPSEEKTEATEPAEESVELTEIAEKPEEKKPVEETVDLTEIKDEPVESIAEPESDEAAEKSSEEQPENTAGKAEIESEEQAEITEKPEEKKPVAESVDLTEIKDEPAESIAEPESIEAAEKSSEEQPENTAGKAETESEELTEIAEKPEEKKPVAESVDLTEIKDEPAESIAEPEPESVEAAEQESGEQPENTARKAEIGSVEQAEITEKPAEEKPVAETVDLTEIKDEPAESIAEPEPKSIEAAEQESGEQPENPAGKAEIGSVEQAEIAEKPEEKKPVAESIEQAEITEKPAEEKPVAESVDLTEIKDEPAESIAEPEPKSIEAAEQESGEQPENTAGKAETESEELTEIAEKPEEKKPVEESVEQAEITEKPAESIAEPKSIEAAEQESGEQLENKTGKAEIESEEQAEITEEPAENTAATETEDLIEITDEDEPEDIEEIEEVDESAADGEEDEADPETETAEESEVEIVEEAVEEAAEVPVQKGSEVEPLVFSQSKPLPKEFIEAVQIVAMEAAKEAAAAAAAAAAKEAAAVAATQVAHEAASQAAAVATQAAAVVSQAARQAAQEAAIATADAMKEIQPTPEEKAAQEKTEAEKAADQPMVEKQITGQLRFNDIIADWEETKKANEERHIQELKQRVKEQTGPLFDDFDATRASQGPELNMLSPVLDVFSDTEDLADEVQQALDEELRETEEVYYGEAEGDADLSGGVITDEDYEIEPVVEADIPEEISRPNLSEQNAEDTGKEEPEDKRNLFNTAEINGLEGKLMSALEGQHYDTSNIQTEILQSYINGEAEEDRIQEEFIQEESVREDPAVTIAADTLTTAPAATSAAEAVAPVKAAEQQPAPMAEPAPVTEQPAPVTEQQAPVAEQQAPVAEQITPAAEQQTAPAAEQSAPTAEQTTPAETDRSQAEEASKSTETGSESVQEGRVLTREEKDLFGSAAQSKEMQQKIATVIDNISMVPLVGNVLMIGEKGTDVELTARDLLRVVGKDHPSVLEVMGAFKAEEISTKNIETTMYSLNGGSLIVENAGDLSVDVCNRILGTAQSLSSILILFIDTPDKIEHLSRTYPKLTDYFTNRLLIDVLDNDGLVKFAQTYANEKEYSIDEMGKLALYNRIDERQRSDHSVTVDEVKEIVDNAISKADKKSVGHLMDIVFAKRYDKEDMIVLKEKDFMEP